MWGDSKKIWRDLSSAVKMHALKRPDPARVVFGYHEIFQALMIAAAALHYAVVALIVLPGAHWHGWNAAKAQRTDLALKHHLWTSTNGQTHCTTVVLVRFGVDPAAPGRVPPERHPELVQLCRMVAPIALRELGPRSLDEHVRGALDMDIAPALAKRGAIALVGERRED
jgi:hypothetical protein